MTLPIAKNINTFQNAGLCLNSGYSAQIGFTLASVMYFNYIYGFSKNRMSGKYSTHCFSLARRMAADAAYIGKNIPFIHSFTELDISEIQEKIRKYRRKNKKKLSLNNFILYCFGKTLLKFPDIHALKGRYNRIYFFEEPDVFFPLEILIENEKILIPVLIRNISGKDLAAIEAEIEKARQRKSIRLSAAQKIFLRMPDFVRHLFYSIWMNSPVTRKKYFGNVYFSAGGMTGMGTGWGLPVPMHPIGLFAGSMADKPVAVNGNIEIRRVLHLTFTADHAIADGGQLARFIAEFFKTVRTETETLDG